MPVDVQVRLTKGHLVGRVVNLTARPVKDLELVSASGAQGTLTRALAPGASAPVDIDVTSGVSSSSGMGGSAQSAPSQGTPISGLSPNSRDALLRLAENQALSGRAGELAVVGFTSAVDSVKVDGGPPARASMAALVEPVKVQTADSLAGIAPRPRLVSNYTGDSSDRVAVYDFDLPVGLTNPVGLTYAMPDIPQPAVKSVEVYDWETHMWRSLAKQTIPSRATGPALMNSGELAGGVVRVRVHETPANGANLSLSDGQNGP